MLVDQRLFLPEVWFGPLYAARRVKCQVPDARQFQTKPQLAAAMLQGIRQEGTSRLIGREAEIQNLNWLQVSGTAERSQVDQRVRHQLHAIVPLLDAFKTEQQPL